MRHLRVLVVVWLLTGLGAVAGSIVGNAFDRRGVFLGAIVAGTLTILLSVRIVSGVGWLDSERRRGASIGAFVGFAFAAALASMNLDTPVIPILVTSLVGVGLLVGAGPNAVR